MRDVERKGVQIRKISNTELNTEYLKKYNLTRYFQESKIPN